MPNGDPRTTTGWIPSRMAFHCSMAQHLYYLSNFSAIPSFLESAVLGHSTPGSIPCDKNLASPSPAVPPFASPLFGWSAGARAELDSCDRGLTVHYYGYSLFSALITLTYIGIAIFSLSHGFGSVRISAFICCFLSFGKRYYKRARWDDGIFSISLHSRERNVSRRRVASAPGPNSPIFLMLSLRSLSLCVCLGQRRLVLCFEEEWDGLSRFLFAFFFPLVSAPLFVYHHVCVH